MNSLLLRLILLRPINPLFHLLADRFNHDGIGDFVIGLLLIATAAPAVDVTWSPLKVAYLIAAVLSGGAIIFSLNLITSISAFWLMDSIPVIRVVFEMHVFARYPLTIYPRAIGIMLTWLIPFGSASYYPASYLL